MFPGVPQLPAQRAPEDRQLELLHHFGFRDDVRDVLASILRHVPVLDADWGSLAARAVVGVCGDVTDGIGVADALDGEVVVHGDGAVFFEGHGWIVLEVVGGGADTNAKDD